MKSSAQTSSKDNWENKEGLLSYSQKVAAVLLGTYAVMFTGCGALFIEERGDIELLGVALTWGTVVMANIYAVGHISGAHINPAITFALAVAGQFPWKKVPIYVVAELMGSIFACLTLIWIFNEEDAAILLTIPVEPNPVSDAKVVVLEFIITFLYAITSFGARTDPSAIKELGGVAVGASVFFAAIIAGKVTGASMNPARSIGPAIVNWNFSKVWIYIISSMMGSLAASVLYFFYLMPQNPEGKNKLNVTSVDPDARLGIVNPMFSIDIRRTGSSLIHADEKLMEIV